MVIRSSGEIFRPGEQPAGSTLTTPIERINPNVAAELNIIGRSIAQYAEMMRNPNATYQEILEIREAIQELLVASERLTGKSAVETATKKALPEPK